MEVLPIVPFSSSTFCMCFLTVVKLSLNQRKDKSDDASGIPLYYHYYPMMFYTNNFDIMGFLNNYVYCIDPIYNHIMLYYVYCSIII